MTLNRRAFLIKALRYGLGLIPLAAMPASSVYRCQIVRRQITLAGLPMEFDGFRVALISDLHHSSWIPPSHIDYAVQLANAESPDLIALTGDFIHFGREWVPDCMRALASLRAREGVVAVLGNHDHTDRSAPLIRQGLKQAGIEDLTNTHLVLRRNRASFVIGGVGDLWREKQDLSGALGPSRISHSTLLLSHNPDFTEIIRDERVGLVLSGHTHGGQCVLPLIGAPWTPSRYGLKYLAGLCQGPVTQVFVTRGAGSSFPPVRIGSPAEVALLTLRCPPARIS